MTAPAKAAPMREDDLRAWGYAPGGYIFQCTDCPEGTDMKDRIGETGDKRSWRCKTHALAARDEARTNLNASVAKPVEDRLRVSRKAAPMREDVTLMVVQDDKGFITLHEPNEDGEPGDLVASVWRDDWLDRLAHSARPNAASMDAKADNMEASPDAGDEARFGASDHACYLYPGEDQQKERAAFCDGAALAAMRKGVDRGMVEQVSVPQMTIEEAFDWMTQKFGDGEDTFFGSLRTLQHFGIIKPALSPEQPR